MSDDQRGPMFDIDGAKNVRLEQNATEGDTLLRGRRLDNVDATANVASGARLSATKPWWQRFAVGSWKWILSVVAGLVILAIAGWMGIK